MAIAMRVTQRLMVERSLTSLQTGLGRLARTQEQLHTGRVINRPSDSPTGTNTAMQLRAEVAGQAQYGRNAQDGLGWLGRVENSLTSVLGSVDRVRGLALQGASTGSNGDQARAALASEVAVIREALLDQANTAHLGRPVFGGTTAGPAAYDADGTFVGNAGAVQRTVADGVQVRVDVSGPAVFGTGADSLFAVLDEVVAHLQTDPESLQGDLDRLDDALSRMRTALADVGTRYGRLEQAAQSARDVTLDLQSSLSEVENVDLARAMVDLQMQEVAYQASLASTARVLQPSLVDFLR